MRALSVYIALAVAIPWTMLHMGYQSHLPDSIGIGAALQLLAYPLTCAFFFFLVWPVALAGGHRRRLDSAKAFSHRQAICHASSRNDPILLLFAPVFDDAGHGAISLMLLAWI
jgi:hypothetical protein